MNSDGTTLIRNIVNKMYYTNEHVRNKLKVINTFLYECI